MAGYRLIGRNRFIPRKTFKGRHREYHKNDPDNPFVNDSRTIVYTEFDVTDCVVQPLTGKTARDYTGHIVPEGSSQYDSFTVYSSVPLLGAKEGTDDLSDQIELLNSRGQVEWFTVIKSDLYQTTGVTRYRSYVISEPHDSENGAI